MIKPMDMVNMYTLMAQDTRESGRMTSNMASVLKLGKMAVHIQDTMQNQRRKERVCTCGLMEINTSENGKTTLFMAMVLISGTMEEFMLVIGKIT